MSSIALSSSSRRANRSGAPFGAPFGASLGGSAAGVASSPISWRLVAREASALLGVIAALALAVFV